MRTKKELIKQLRKFKKRLAEDEMRNTTHHAIYTELQAHLIATNHVTLADILRVVEEGIVKHHNEVAINLADRGEVSAEFEKGYQAACIKLLIMIKDIVVEQFSVRLSNGDLELNDEN